MKTKIQDQSWRQQGATLRAFVLSTCMIGSMAGGAGEAPSSTTAAEAKPKLEKASEKSETEYRNWLDVSVGGILTEGNRSQYQRRYGQPDGVIGGVESFHYEQDVGKKGLFQIDGRGIFDNHDYSLKVSLENPDIGFVRAGYQEFRSWFDGSGGFFPANGQWLSLYDDQMAVDRGEAWFEGGLTLPGKPELTFKYSHQFRKGEKDSTSWGDSNLTGGLGLRAFAPSFWTIDEKRDTFEGNIKHKIAKTEFGLGLRYEISDSNDSLNLRRTPQEPVSLDRSVTQREGANTDLLNVHAFTETRFNEKVLLTTGYSFTTLDTDLSGYRVYGSNYDSDALAGRLPSPDSFQGLGGGSQLNQHVGNLNLMLNLADSLVLVPAVRVEEQDTESMSFYSQPAEPFTGFPYAAGSDRGLLDVSESLELRYTGVTNWVFYLRGNWLEGSGDMHETWRNLGTGALIFDPERSTDDTRFEQKYSAGANWYPLRQLNFGAGYYHKERKNDYSHELDPTPNLGMGLWYPAFLTAQEYVTDDANFRATWRPLANLSLIARYDFQFSTIDTRPDGLPEIKTSEMTSHMISGTINWSPFNRLYLLGGVNRVWDQTDTPADEMVASVQQTRDNYWTVNSAVGYALDPKTDLELQYLFYQTDNYQDNSAFGFPYNASAEEHGITTSLIRRISERIRWTLRYGYFDGRDKTSGHYNDYQAHTIFSSFRYRF